MPATDNQSRRRLDVLKKRQSDIPANAVVLVVHICKQRHKLKAVLPIAANYPRLICCRAEINAVLMFPLIAFGNKLVYYIRIAGNYLAKFALSQFAIRIAVAAEENLPF